MSASVVLPASSMPKHRKTLRHMTLRYEDAGEDFNDNEEESKNSSRKVLIVEPNKITAEEKILLNTRQTPAAHSKVLLHSCCAPCSGAMVEKMHFDLDLDVTIFFYNPNIHPKKEYEIRKEENKRYAQKHNIPFVDCDYDSDTWFQRMVGFELEPERGVRCSACFDMRMEVTAAYAVANGFSYFTTTNATSRWKDETQVNLAGIRAADYFNKKNTMNSASQSDKLEDKKEIKIDDSSVDTKAPIVQFWVYNWQTDSMTRRKYEVSVEEKFYKQEYCGCSYSLRDSNIWRAQQGLQPVKIGGESAGLGTRYFENVDTDEAEESQDVVDAFFKDANDHFGDKKRIINQQSKLHKSVSKNMEHASVFDGRMKNSNRIELNNW